MTVAELIAKLRGYPQELPVVLSAEGVIQGSPDIITIEEIIDYYPMAREGESSEVATGKYQVILWAP